MIHIDNIIFISRNLLVTVFVRSINSQFVFQPMRKRTLSVNKTNRKRWKPIRSPKFAFSNLLGSKRCRDRLAKTNYNDFHAVCLNMLLMTLVQTSEERNTIKI